MFKHLAFYRLHRQNIFFEVLLSLLIIALLMTLEIHEMSVAMRKADRIRAFSDFQPARLSTSEYFALNGFWPTHEVTYIDEGGTLGREVKVVDGAIHLDMRSHHDSSAGNKILSFRPAILTAGEAATVVWVCGNAAVPEGMQAAGENATTLRGGELYAVCR